MAHAGPRPRVGQRGQQLRIVAPRRIEEERADRGQHAGERIEGFQRAREVAQRPEHGEQPVVLVGSRAQTLECRERGIAGRGEGPAHLGERIRPMLHLRTRGAQRIIRRAGRMHHGLEIRRVQVAGDERERLEAAEQWPQQGDEVF